MAVAASGIAFAGQLLLLACAYMPGVAEPARGAMLLISIWFFGMNAGALLFGVCERR